MRAIASLSFWLYFLIPQSKFFPEKAKIKSCIISRFFVKIYLTKQIHSAIITYVAESDKPNIGDLCNGSTTDSDSVCEGSNPSSPARKNLIANAMRFFQRNKSLRICEMPCGREIWLRHVKCLRTWVDLFHFTFCDSRKFHNSRSELFHRERKRTISL